MKLSSPCIKVVDRLEHLVLTVADLNKTINFYSMALGMEVIRFGEGRVALAFGRQKINLHEAGKEFEPKANVLTPGSADLCFITNISLDDVIKHLITQKIMIEEGPVMRAGVLGPINSVYKRSRSESNRNFDILKSIILNPAFIRGVQNY